MISLHARRKTALIASTLRRPEHSLPGRKSKDAASQTQAVRTGNIVPRVVDRPTSAISSLTMSSAVNPASMRIRVIRDDAEKASSTSSLEAGRVNWNDQ